MGFNFFTKNKIIIGCAAACCLLMVVLPEVTATGAKTAISLWLNSIVPTMLPFFIGANFLKNTGAVSRISPKVYPFAMAVLSGYPMGARIAGDYYREGMASKEQLSGILSYSMVTGPAFMIGAVGVEFLGSYKLGVMLAASHYLGALVCGLLFSTRKGQGISKPSKTAVRAKRTGSDYYQCLTDSIIDSFKAIAIILAYIIIFMICCDLLQFSGVLMLMPSPEAEAVSKGFLEMTVGLAGLTYCSAGIVTKTALASFMVSFGGLSVIGQSMSMLSGCPVKFWQLFKIKLVHGIVSGILAFGICAIVVQ